MLKSFRPYVLTSAVVLALAVGAGAPAWSQGANPASPQISNADIERIQALLAPNSMPAEIQGGMGRLTPDQQDELRRAFLAPNLGQQSESLAKLFERLTPLQQVGLRNIMAGLVLNFGNLGGTPVFSFFTPGLSGPGDTGTQLGQVSTQGAGGGGAGGGFGTPFFGPTPPLRYSNSFLGGGGGGGGGGGAAGPGPGPGPSASNTE